jgi:hypothetical protein
VAWPTSPVDVHSIADGPVAPPLVTSADVHVLAGRPTPIKMIPTPMIPTTTRNNPRILAHIFSFMPPN